MLIHRATENSRKGMMKYDFQYVFQPIREAFMALAITLMLVAFWQYHRSGTRMDPIVYLESALILVIAAEAYAKDV